MNVDVGIVGRLERGELPFSPLYESKFKEAMERLRVSNVELVIRTMLEMKAK
ncbi:hypothetical protein [Priestia megaterium]|uniref:hypothetical protein n=1 Tax=Priestia megaterium TaxID=1404 RepID=UPI003CEA2F6C